MRQSRWVAAFAAGVLLMAAAAKLEELPWAALTTNRPKWDSAGRTGLAVIEAGLAASLLVMDWRGRWQYLPGACFTAFAAVATFKAMGGAVSCGCFGRVAVPPWLTAASDVVLALSLWTWPSVGPVFGRRWPRGMRTAVVGGVVLTTLEAGVWRYPTAHAAESLGERGKLLRVGSVTVLRPTAWMGKGFPLVDEIDVGEDLMHGRWLVVIYQSDCSTCHEALPGYVARAGLAPDTRTALVQMPPHVDEPAGSAPGVLRGRLSAGHEWFASTPMALLVEDGTVRDAAEG